MAPILKHGPEFHQAPCLWILAGTGEGPQLTRCLLQRGWRLRVSVVSEAAAAAYRPLLASWGGGDLAVLVGPLQGVAAMAQQLQRLASAGDRPSAVVDATHPFAVVVSRDLAALCRQRQLPLLRLQRQSLPLGDATLVADLAALAPWDLAGEPLLLALGSRQLPQAIAATPGALHHARVLPNPLALQLALAAGLAPQRIACLRPGSDLAVEQGLLRHWQIRVIVCRQSGGWLEALWHQLSQSSGCRLLLLRRPAEASGVLALSFEALLARLERPIAAFPDG